jgi:hypothetical protein
MGKRIPYVVRWGHKRGLLKGDPKRTARRMRAYARGAAVPGTKPNPSKEK